MRRLGDVRLPPLAWVAIAAAVAALLRFTVALLVQTPLYYPDEYLNAAVSRSIGDGMLGQIRGGSGPPSSGFTSYFAPLLQAPAWQIDDVAVGYRLAQALGAIAMASAAFPAYALARRLGVSSHGSCVTALLTLVAPAGVLSANILAEPYAYPLFLAAVLVAVNALAKGKLLHHVGAIGAAVGLCFVGGLQFAFFGVAYAAVWCVLDWRSPREVAKRLAIVVGAVVVAVGITVAAGRGGYIEFLLGAVTSERWAVGALAGWLAANALILAIAAGWVVLPGAILGLRRLGGSANRAHRGFAYLSILVIVGMLVEAALWGTKDQGLYERFTFYGAPLVAVAFTWSVQYVTPRRLGYAAAAYVAALGAVLLPVTDPLFAALDDHSPTLLGLTKLALGSEVGGGIWAPLLALLALLTAWRGHINPRPLIAVALTTGALTSIGASIVFAQRAQAVEHQPRLGLPTDATIITWEGTSKALLGETLFWNPEIVRVALVGPGVAPDLLPFVPARLAAGGKLLDQTGRPLRPPYVIGPDVVAVGPGASGGERARLVLLHQPPSVLVFGWYRDIGYLGFGGLLYGAADQDPWRLLIHLRSPKGSKTLTIRCDTDFELIVRVRLRPRTIALPIPSNSVRSCRYALQGRFERIGGRAVSVEARIGSHP